MLTALRSSLRVVSEIPAARLIPAMVFSRFSHCAVSKVDMTQFEQPMSPVVKMTSVSGGKKLDVSYPEKYAKTLAAEIPSVVAPYGVTVTKQQVQEGRFVKASYQLSAAKPLSDAQWDEIVGDISHAAALPKSAIGPIANLPLTRKQQSFTYTALKFAMQFVNRYDDDYHAISSILGNVPGNAPKVLLNNLKRRLRQDTFNESNVLASLTNNLELVKEIYAVFDARFNPKTAKPTEEQFAKTMKDLETRISKLPSEFDAQVLKAVTSMVNSSKKTNFYRNEKIAIISRLDGKFVNPKEYPATPYGVFFCVGSEFRGIHVRFSDIARGGIRVIKSPTRQAYANNVSTQFDENYNLAYTQQKKNKDIPEGGSKGTLLLNPANQDAGDIAFHKYVCSLMDVLVPECVQVDYTGRNIPEILFLGPDEYTADLMGWAVEYTKTRKYQVWKAVTTGKPPSLGGIPHDTYGMTTRSVHQFVLGTLEKAGVKEENVTKFVTGGPDGDLGSNEVTISKDSTIGIVDGSGVVYDPQGLSREELNRLVEKRSMVRDFNKSKLSPKGFFVDINDKNVTLPDGTVVEDGMAFRNNFHLNPLSSADLFVPCGGRPESISASNLPQVLDSNGKCRWKYIVEGANLFCTQAARQELEKLGVILFKDASTNKGGVTSSSKEVTAALALSDADFEKHMKQGADGSLPEFYQSYVQDVIECVEKNARSEFECMWKAREETGMMSCDLTDKISLHINAVGDAIHDSPLFENEKLRKIVLKEYLPKTLIAFQPIEVTMKNIPENYQRACFATHLATKFVYGQGYVNSMSPLSLHKFLAEYEAKL